MRYLLPLLSVWFTLALISCENKEEKPIDVADADVVMETDQGDIYIKLYDITPLHKENFLKLVEADFYDSLTFHRVIQDFIIQTGDPRTRPGATTEEDDAGYKLPAEIVDTLLHTQGKVAAARFPDDINPEWESSSSQFYIVTGEFVTEEQLDQAEMAFNHAREMRLRRAHQTLQDSGKYEGSFNDYLSEKGFQEIYYTDEQKAVYDEVQGAPNLDFQYTIFGEVVAGMEIANRIERMPAMSVRIIDMRIIEQ